MSTSYAEMERLKNLDNYFKEKSRKKLQAEAQLSPLGIPTMSAEEIKQSCAENNGYETPELNDKLYLHMRGFDKIQNLEPYTGCKAIWLESNAISKIEGLDTLVECRCLYLAKNMISKIEGLLKLSDIMSLDLSNNRIRTIENLSCCPQLDTLNISKNFLETAESIEHLGECHNLRTLDLTNNKLPAENEVVDMLKNIPRLATLSINGNEITKLPGYRKKMITSIPSLGYLDRPIDEVEHLTAAAFMEGGPEAEKIARDKYRDEQQQKRKDEMAQFKVWQAEEREKRVNMPMEKKHEIATLEEERRRAREIEANRDAAMEAKALELGVSKLALHMMHGDGSINEFYAAQKAAVEANKGTSEAPRVEELPEVPIPTEEEASSAPLPPPAPTQEEEEMEHPPVAEETAEEREAREKAEAEALAVKEREEKEAIEKAAERKRLEQEENERAERVAESTHIWKQQQAAAKAAKKEEQARASATAIAANVESARVLEVDENAVPLSSNKVMFWSESEDIELARQVMATMFDFDEVSAGLVKKFDKPELTAEACRERWAQLDAEQWSEPADEGGAPTTTLFKNYVSDAVVSEMLNTGKKGHGLQPSFENLASMARGQKPGYLKMPMSFPSTADIPDDENLESLD